MSDPDPEGYDVGYKKPPKAHQFSKGKSGNPRGRPKRPDGISIAEMLDVAQRAKNGSRINLREGLLATLFTDAMNGKPKAFGKIVDYLQRTGMLRKDTAPVIQRFTIPIDRMSPESPLTYITWLEKEGKHELAAKIRAKYGL